MKNVMVPRTNKWMSKKEKSLEDMQNKEKDKKCNYEPLTIKVTDDIQSLLDWMVNRGLAREIHPQIMETYSIENERQVNR